MTSKILFGLRKTTEILDKTVSWTIILCMAAMTLTIIAQVVLRYFFHSSLSWGWIIPRLTFIWLVLLSIPLAFKYNLHVGVDILFQFFPASTKKFLTRLNALAMIALSLVVFYYGYEMMIRVHDQFMPGSTISVGLLYYALLVSQIHICLHLAEMFIVGEVSHERLEEI